MTSSRQVSAVLEALSTLVDEPGSNVSDTISRLSMAVGHAVDTFCGLRINAGTSPGSMQLTVGPAGDPLSVLPPAHSSLRLGSSLLTTREPALEIILFATRPGAFVDLAADITWATSASPYTVEVDRHLGVLAHGDHLTELEEASAVDQAIGTLLARGITTARARAAIDAHAVRQGITPGEAAREIVEDMLASGSDGHGLS